MSKSTYTLAQLAQILRAKPVAAGSTTFSRVSTDTRTIQPGDVFFALSGERFDGNEFLAAAFAGGACGAVARRDDPAGPCIVVDDVQRALQQFASYHRAEFGIPVLALTGSCGKTTSKDMIAAVLASRYNVLKTQGNFNNEIGCPLTLLKIEGSTGFAVIEMGANHPGEIARLCELVLPTQAAVTLVAPAHLEGFGSIENVARAKGEIVRGLRRGGIFYVNADDEWCVKMAAGYDGEKIFFGKKGDISLESCQIVAPGRACVRIEPVGEMDLPLACPAHATNVLLAVAVGLRHGVTEFEGPLREAARGGSRFKILDIGPLTVIDDSYNANPASVAAALDALEAWPAPNSPARMAALGEMLELGESAQRLHREIGERAARAGVTHLFARGPHACDTIDAAKSGGVAHAEVIDNPNEIAAAVQRFAGPGGLLLVKGSRGMEMERVISALRELYAH
ncbi:MAG: UDP-N-acetylmuramoyl-tripeptide--D-alanyl-D-alanine ligase [Candidatus Hydrogenedentes bacterium]|nr:UDP-N-acetylmuramoyl-tripeptide--D-alanyl-D-alanine ligase [Candidatus Hydrogenedentota bacterium]